MKKIILLLFCLVQALAFSSISEEFFPAVETKLSYSYRGVQSSKETALILLKELKEEGILQTNAPLQPFFSNIERMILDTLLVFYAEGKITDLVGVIHQDEFFIPLCFDVGEYDPADVKESIKSKGELMKTYLESGAVLYHLYPKGSRETVSEGELVLYQKNLESFNFFDQELDTVGISGITFLFESEGKKWVFCADFPKSFNGETELVLLFNEIEHNEKIKERVDLALKMVESFPEIRTATVCIN